MDPVRAVHVRVPGRPEHRRVPRGLPAVAVRRRILVVVGLDLDDRPPHAVHEERHADQVGGDLVHRAREEFTRERASAASFAS